LERCRAALGEPLKSGLSSAREFMNCKAAVAMLVLVCGLSQPASAGLFEEGSNAWDRGEHTVAIRIFRHLADQGDPKAQNKLGTMYQHGWGVPQNYLDAVSWFRQAADRGDADAQSNLGFMFLYGRGVARDYVSAHLWFDLAASGGNRSAVFARDLVAAKMTPAQVAEAQKRARAWEPK
jgi:TPR repeat protein